MNKAAQEMAPSGVTKTHLGNDRIRRYPEGWIARYPVGEKACLVGRAMTLRPNHGVVMRRMKFESSADNATKPELVTLNQSTEGARRGGRGERAPGIFKIAPANSSVVERTPSYRPGVRPTEFIWPRRNGGRATLYDTVWAGERARIFCDELSECDMGKIVDHCDKAAERMIDGEAVRRWAATSRKAPAAQTRRGGPGEGD